MIRHTGKLCGVHTDPYECPDQVIIYSDVFDEYGLIVHDGGRSSYDISFCPFCGSQLPKSKRDQWWVLNRRLVTRVFQKNTNPVYGAKTVSFVFLSLAKSGEYNTRKMLSSIFALLALIALN